MNILHLSRHGEMDRRISGEMNYLARQGHQVFFLSTPVSLEGAGLEPEIRCLMEYAPRQPGPPAQGRSLNARIRRAILALPVSLALPCYAFLIGLMDRRLYARLEALRKSGMPGITPDFIHIHDLRLAEYALFLKQRFPAVKLIYDSHELTPFQNSNLKVSRYILERERRIIHRMDAVITVNQSIAGRMRELYGLNRVHVLYNSAEPIADEGDQRMQDLFLCPELPADTVKVLFQGSLTENRNLENLVRAFSLLPKQFHLFILGNGPLKKELRALAGSNVHFADSVKQAALLPMTRQADFGIIPYLGDACENNRLCTPNKFFEFLEARLPICSSRLLELNRILELYQNGACFTMRSPEEIAMAIMEMQKRIERGEFTKSALEAAARDYSFERQIRVLDEVYQS